MTLEDMEQDEEFKKQQSDLQKVGQAALTREERLIRQRALDRLNVPSFHATCKVRSCRREGMQASMNSSRKPMQTEHVSSLSAR